MGDMTLRNKHHQNLRTDPSSGVRSRNVVPRGVGPGSLLTKRLVLPPLRLYQRPVMYSEVRDDMTISAPQLGKSFTGVLWLLAAAWLGGKSIRPWWIVAPTFSQAGHAFRLFCGLAESAGVLRNATRTPPLYGHLVNGAFIEARSWDRPEGMYGPTIRGAMVDEFGQLTPWAYSAISSRRAESISIGEGKVRWLGNVGEIGGAAEQMWDQAVRGDEGFACRRWSWFDRADAHGCVCGDCGIAPDLETADAHGPSCPRGIYLKFIRAEKTRMSGPQFRQLYGAEWADWNLLPVYTFDRERHLDNSIVIDPRFPLEVSCDFNVDPMAWTVGQHHGDEIWVHSEIALPGGATTVKACKEVMRRFPNRSMDVVIFGDATGGRRQTSASETDYQTIKRILGAFYRSFSSKVPGRNPRVVDRVNAFNAKLESAAGGITWRCHPRCAGLIKDLARVSWRAGTREINTKNRALTHFSDAEGYRLQALFPIRAGSSISAAATGLGSMEYRTDEVLGAVW